MVWTMPYKKTTYDRWLIWNLQRLLYEPLHVHLISFIKSPAVPSASHLTGLHIFISATLPSTLTNQWVPAFETLIWERNFFQLSCTKDSLAVALRSTDEFSTQLIWISSVTCLDGNPKKLSVLRPLLFCKASSNMLWFNGRDGMYTASHVCFPSL
jgi:hypothetical protein